MTLLARGWPSLSPHLVERLRRIMLWGGLAGVAGWVHLAQFSTILQWDSHIFMVIAQQIRRGLLPYRDLWELKPPGIFYYLAAVFTAFPEALWSVRFTDWALSVVAAICFYRVCRTEVRPPIAFFGTSVWLYFSHHPTFDVGGVYTEEYAAICAILAVAAAANYARTGALHMAGLSGVAVACAALFKHPGIAAFAPSVIIMGRRPRFSAALLLWLGLALPIGLTVAYFWAHGALDDFLTCNVWALQTHGGLKRGVTEELIKARVLQLWVQGSALLAPFAILPAALALGVPVCLLRPTFLRWAALVWVVIDFAGVAAQRNYYPHHYILTFPSTCLLGTLAFGWLVQPRPNEHRLVTLPRIAVTVALLWWALPSAREAYAARQEVVREQWDVLLSGPGAWQKSPARRFEEDVGGYIRQRTQPHDRIHLQGWGATALGIYWEAGRRVATRFFYEAPFPIDTRRELAELQENRPEYVVVVSNPPYLFLSGWLASDYSLESVKWLDYPARIFVRTRERPLADGVAAQVVQSPEAGALTLPGTHPADGPLQLLPEPRRGWWTSPALRIQSDDGTVAVDWSPRGDLAYNRTGHGLATIEAASRDPDNDAKVLLGAVTQRGRWSAWFRQETVPITLSFGFTAVIDHVTLKAANAAGAEEGCSPPEIFTSVTANDAGSFAAVEGTWHVEEPGIRTFRFSPRPAAALRVLGSPASCDFGYGITRIHVGASGMGVRVRYRVGAAPDLSAAPWREVGDDEDQLKVPGARYVQMQYELWSDYADVGPVLQHAQVGRMRFVPETTVTGAATQ